MYMTKPRNPDATTIANLQRELEKTREIYASYKAAAQHYRGMYEALKSLQAPTGESTETVK